MIGRRLLHRTRLPLITTLALFALATCTNPTFIEFARYVAPGAVRPAGYDSALQWNMEMINAPDAWGILDHLSSESYPVGRVLVAVLDTGIDADHPALDGQVRELLGNDVTLEPSDSANEDLNGHGTHVAGIIASYPPVTDESPYGVSVPWVEVFSVKVFRGSGEQTSTGEVTLGIDYATALIAEEPAIPVKVINLSLGGEGADAAMFEAIARAIDAGITVVAAAGNANQEKVVYPAAFSNVIGVGAVDRLSSRWEGPFPYGSDYGVGLDFMAPGTEIRSTTNDGEYGSKTGTSMATPHVAGVAALLYAVEPGLNQDAVYSILRATARDLGATGWDKYYGHGLVDAKAALEYLINLQGRMPRAPMGADAPRGSGGLRLEPQTLSGAQLPPADAEYDSHSIILRFHEGQEPATDAEFAQLEADMVQDYGISSLRRIGNTMAVAELGAGQQPIAAMESLAGVPEVQYSQPNYLYRPVW